MIKFTGFGSINGSIETLFHAKKRQFEPVMVLTQAGHVISQRTNLAVIELGSDLVHLQVV